MKKVTFNELLEDIAKEYNKFHEVDFVTGDMMKSELERANYQYTDEKGIDIFHLEFTKVYKAPLVYEFGYKYNENEDSDYYIY